MKISQTKNIELIAQLNKHVHDLHYNLYPEYFKKYNFKDVKEVFKSIINKPNNLFLLLEEKNEAVGYAWIEIKEYPENAFKKSYKSIYVHQICIMDSKRNNGHGSFLLNEIYHIAQNKGIELVELDYWCENKIAKSFYQKHKFKKYREIVFRKV